MSSYFLDASAIVKRYSVETGSSWICEITDPGTGHLTMVSEITMAETAAAFAAKHRAPNGLTREELADAMALFVSHCESQYALTAVSRRVIDRAMALTQVYRLRGYDAVQLGAALTANDILTAAGLDALTFVAADSDLLAAADAEGMATANPNVPAGLTPAP